MRSVGRSRSRRDDDGGMVGLRPWGHRVRGRARRARTRAAGFRAARRLRGLPRRAAPRRRHSTVTFTPAPTVERADTVATVTDSSTVVEGGTQTRSYARTVTAYLGSHVAYVAVVTDPGSPNPQLGQEFAAGLLQESVSALRG